MLEADRRLRAAYARAARAHAPTSVLLDYRERWVALRLQSSRRPDRLIAGYATLERRLDRLAAAHARRVRR